MVQQLNCTISDLKQVVDRLATTGLGYPLFSSPLSPASLPDTEVEEESISEEEMEQAYIRNLQRTPSKLARYLELKAKRDRYKVNRGPSVARVPAEPQEVAAVTAALDQAEEAGRKGPGADFVKWMNASLGKKA
jgi:hypothetical protein